MKKSILFAATFLLVTPLYAAPPTYFPEDIADRVMKVKDSNSNGSIEQAEYEQTAVSKFNAIDTDGDKVISADEMFAHRYAGRSEMNMKSSEAKGIIIGSVLKRWDKNSDKMVSLDEHLQPVRSEFSSLDRDDDGLVTRAELVRHWTRKKAELEKSRNSDSKSHD